MLPLDAPRRSQPAAAPHPYLETTTLIQRASRRLLDMIENALRREGSPDITAVQALMLHSIGEEEVTSGALRKGGHYLGTNATPVLNKLVEMGLLDRKRSQTDGRSVRIRITDKGRAVRDIIDALYGKHVRTVEHLGGVSAADFATLNRALQRLERFWGDQVRYQL